MIIIIMKKNRKVGNRTDTNFFTSEFKLTSSRVPKPHRQHKMLSTFSQFKQGLFNEESRLSRRDKNEEKKNIM